MDDREQSEIEARLRGQIEGYHESALLFTAVTSGLPDLLSQGPLPVETLAEELGLEPTPLNRFLRGLVTMRLCEEGEDGRFGLTAVGKSLRHGGKSSLREKAFVVVGQYWLPWMSLMYCLKTGKPSFPFAFKKTVEDWRGRNAEEGKFFFRYLAKEEEANSGPFVEAIKAQGALEAGVVLTSLGGGYGAWLLSALRTDASLRAVVFDAQAILDEAVGLFEDAGLSDRVALAAGDILEAIPVKADVYVLKGVLQSHDDAGTKAILENCREAMMPGAKLLIAERLLPEETYRGHEPGDAAAIMLDLHMMVVTGGKARTKTEMEALITTAGLAVTDVFHSADGLTLIEARLP